MKPAQFDFRRAGGAAQASYLSDGEKPVAGNQSLGPMLNLRLARPQRLVEVAALPELRAVTETEDAVRFGAAITHAEIEDGDVPDPTGGWMRAVASNIAHRAVRNRGTIGGSLAHADPAADWPLATTGLGAFAVVRGPGGEKKIAMEDFLTGPYSTALGPLDLIVAVEVPKPGAAARWGYWKFVRQVGEFAKASAAVLIDPASGRHRCVVGALGRQPLVLADAEAIVAGRISATEALTAALPERDFPQIAMHVAALERALAMADGKETP